MSLASRASILARLLTLPAALIAAGCGSHASTPATTTIEGPATGGWKLIGPGDWTSKTLEVHATGLAADERLALVLVNAGGPDHASVTVSVAGSSATVTAPEPASLALVEAAASAPPQPDRAAMIALQRAGLERWLAGEGAAAPGTRAQPRVQAAAAAAVGDKRSFCVLKDPTRIQAGFALKSATLRHVGANALYYVTDDVWSGRIDGAQNLSDILAGRPNLFANLEDFMEGSNSSPDQKNAAGTKHILSSLLANFGPLSDYDGNGRIIFLFTNLSSPSGSGNFVVGFFYSNDIQTQDGTCTGTGTNAGSNGADMLYLIDPGSFFSKGGRTIDTILDEEIPSVMAHELQHDVLFNARCYASGVQARCFASGDPSATGDLWLNEGLSMNSEDLAGFGLNFASVRSYVGGYLSCKVTSSHTCHESASLTSWDPGDPFGNYGAASAFLRWHVDQKAKVSAAASQTFLKGLVGATIPARNAVASGSGLSFEEGYARFTTAALFEGETFNPEVAWDFAAGVAWSPLHTQVGRPSWTPLSPVSGAVTTTLRTDSWWAYQTGLGSGTDATLTVTSSAAVRPRVVVTRFKGRLTAP